MLTSIGQKLIYLGQKNQGWKTKVDKFKDSKLRVTTNVKSSREEAIKSEEANLFHDVDGFHETRSSIHYPHKIPISNGGAKVGDSLTFKAELIGGNHFKIAGLAFCK